MLPKWFNEWNEKNPTNIFGPAVLIGTVGVAVAAAALIVTWGQPYATTSLQTGPRGTGMSVPEFDTARLTPDPAILFYYTDEPFYPREGDELAGDVYENVQVLGGVTVDNFNRLMNAMTQWIAPEEGCAYCHAGANEGNFADDSLYTYHVSRRMIQMTQAINDYWVGHVQANDEVGVVCYTCHRGQNVPNNIWYRVGDVNEAADGWAAVQNRVTMVSNHTSLPSSYLEEYLLADEDGEYAQIVVHDLASRVVQRPGDPLIQETERTYAFMNYISNSLGVNCLFCHNSRAFYAASGQVTPQWATASLGIQMAQEINTEYLAPLQDVYPPERLGPVFGDAPLAACRTCHQGYQQPLQGLHVIGNWPELATTTGDYDYAAFAPDAPAEEEPAPEEAVAPEEIAPGEDVGGLDNQTPADGDDLAAEGGDAVDPGTGEDAAPDVEADGQIAEADPAPDADAGDGTDEADIDAAPSADAPEAAADDDTADQ